MNPNMLVPIHTFQPEEYGKHFENVQLKADGEWWEV
jgi:ribonuclease J